MSLPKTVFRWDKFKAQLMLKEGLSCTFRTSWMSAQQSVVTPEDTNTGASRLWAADVTLWIADPAVVARASIRNVEED